MRSLQEVENQAAILVIGLIAYSQPRSAQELAIAIETLMLKSAEVVERHTGREQAQITCQRVISQLSINRQPHKMN